MELIDQYPDRETNQLVSATQRLTLLLRSSFSKQASRKAKEVPFSNKYEGYETWQGVVNTASCEKPLWRSCSVYCCFYHSEGLKRICKCSPSELKAKVRSDEKIKTHVLTIWFTYNYLGLIHSLTQRWNVLLGIFHRDQFQWFFCFSSALCKKWHSAQQFPYSKKKPWKKSTPTKNLRGSCPGQKKSVCDPPLIQKMWTYLTGKTHLHINIQALLMCTYVVSMLALVELIIQVWSVKTYF